MGMTTTAGTKEAPYYFVPGLSGHPARAATSLLAFMIGMSMWVNSNPAGMWITLASIAAFMVVLYFWFGEAIAESEGGLYGKRVDLSYRWSMSWFIFSEVMFFAAFFGALFYARVVTMPWLGDLDHKTVLWPDFNANWPHAGPGGIVAPFQTMGPFWLPTINTMLLLTSGVTLTIAHHALRHGQRGVTSFWLLVTVILGAVFMCVQGYEYYHAYNDLGLTLGSGIFGSTFFMLTGFHGFHVTMGAIMLAVVWVRLQKGHFTAENHFAFEGAAWYWHFVDVVWLGLYVFVYWV